MEEVRKKPHLLKAIQYSLALASVLTAGVSAHMYATYKDDFSRKIPLNFTQNLNKISFSQMAANADLRTEIEPIITAQIQVRAPVMKLKQVHRPVQLMILSAVEKKADVAKAISAEVKEKRSLEKEIHSALRMKFIELVTNEEMKLAPTVVTNIAEEKTALSAPTAARHEIVVAPLVIKKKPATIKEKVVPVKIVDIRSVMSSQPEKKAEYSSVKAPVPPTKQEQILENTETDDYSVNEKYEDIGHDLYELPTDLPKINRVKDISGIQKSSEEGPTLKNVYKLNQDNGLKTPPQIDTPSASSNYIYQNFVSSAINKPTTVIAKLDTPVKRNPAPAAPVSTPSTDTHQEDMSGQKTNDYSTEATVPNNTGASARQNANDSGVEYRIAEGLTGGKKMVEGAKIQILGSSEVYESNFEGTFYIKSYNTEGVVPAFISKAGYLSRRVELQNKTTTFELVSENTAAISAVAAGSERQPGTAFVFGELKSKNKEGLSGHRIEVEGNGTADVVYLSEAGLPDRSLKSTSKRGQFILINVTAGTHNVMAIDQAGIEKAPHLIHLSENEGVVKKFELGESVRVAGILGNALYTAAPIGEAKLQIVGTTRQITSQKKGGFDFGMMYLDCSEMNFIQMDKSGFYRNRARIKCGTENAIYAFPAAHVDALAAEMQSELDAGKGIVIGNMQGRKNTKMQLMGMNEIVPSAEPRGYDYYFDNDGVLNLDRNLTSGNGNFFIVGAPDGMSYIQAVNKSNETIGFWPTFISPSTVTVFVQ